MKKIIEKHLVIFCILVSFGLLEISSLFSWDSNPVMGYDKLCADITITVCCVLLIVVLGYKETAGFTLRGYGKGLLYGVPFLVIGIASVFVSNAGVDFSKLTHLSVANTILFTVNMIFVGINEEMWLRGLVLNSLLRKYGDSYRGMWKSLWISAMIFGAIHIPNAFFMEPLTLLVQVVNAAAGGILFGAIFIKSKNLWAGITIHALVDWFSLFLGNCFTGTESIISMSMTIPQAIVIILLGATPPIVIAWLLLLRLRDLNKGAVKK